MLVIAALCQNVIVYLESTIEALILLMKSKLAYIKTTCVTFDMHILLVKMLMLTFFLKGWKNRNTPHTIMLFMGGADMLVLTENRY